MIYQGKPAKGIEFYNLLFESDNFNVEMGKVTLAAGKLEAELILFLTRNNVTENITESTLGKLIKVGEKYKLFDENLFRALSLVCKQRNYLTHNIYALFIDLIDETILEKHNLIDTDVVTYCDRAYVLRENLDGLANIISKK